MSCIEGLISRRNKFVYEVARNTGAVGKIVRKLYEDSALERPKHR
jgi:hypothetical protein